MTKKDVLRNMYTIVPNTISKIINKVVFFVNRVNCGKAFKSRRVIKISRVFCLPFMSGVV